MKNKKTPSKVVVGMDRIFKKWKINKTHFLPRAGIYDTRFNHCVNGTMESTPEQDKQIKRVCKEMAEDLLKICD